MGVILLDDVIRPAVEEYGTKQPMIEVGSGNTARGREYGDCTCTDRVHPVDRPTDVLADGHMLPFRDRGVGTVFCFETLEHVVNPMGFVKEVSRVLKEGGIFYLTTVFVWVYHPEPVDYWRFTTTAIKMLLSSFKLLPLKIFEWRGCNYRIGEQFLNDHILGVAIKR